MFSDEYIYVELFTSPYSESDILRTKTQKKKGAHSELTKSK